MNFDLQPVTASGEKYVALAEGHIPSLEESAPRHDLENSFPHEHFDAMKASGLLAACVPQELGGIGVESIHDYMLGINRLGRGDGATAIAANMHIFQTWRLARAWRTAVARNQDVQATALSDVLRGVAQRGLIVSPLLSEAGTDVLHPLTVAEKSPAGWTLNGRKIFATLSPISEIFSVLCQATDLSGTRQTCLATLPRNTPGLEILGNWNAMGMRASGSHDVNLKNCSVPEHSVLVLGPWGTWIEPVLGGNLTANMGLAAAFLGIAEAARTHVISFVKKRRKAPSNRTLSERSGIQHAIAEIEISLSASRAVLGRSALLADMLFERHKHESIPMDALHQQMKDFQCAKWLVLHKAIEIVDKALTVSGGAGYHTSNPLSRMYRDVRAGPFMQLFSPNEVFEYIGKVALGIEPILEN